MKARLKPGGVFAMYNYFRFGWVAGRLNEMVKKVYGVEPVVVPTTPAPAARSVPAPPAVVPPSAPRSAPAAAPIQIVLPAAKALPPQAIIPTPVAPPRVAAAPVPPQVQVVLPAAKALPPASVHRR